MSTPQQVSPARSSVGEARVAGSVKLLPEPVVFGEKAFPFGCDLQITGLAARNVGPELRDMVSKLHLFPDPQTWSAAVLTSHWRQDGRESCHEHLGAGYPATVGRGGGSDDHSKPVRHTGGCAAR